VTYANWTKTEAPDYLQRDRLIMLCELVLDNVEHEDYCSSLVTRQTEACTCEASHEVVEMFIDPASNTAWSHSLKRSGSSWTLAFLS